MADEPLPDENIVPPPLDDASDVDSHDLSEIADMEDNAAAREGSDEEGEDLMENMSGDYRAMSGLDRYEQDDIDDADAGQDVTFEEAQAARLRAEAELDRRDVREGVGGRRQRLPGALEEDVDEEDRRPTQRRRVERAQAGIVDDDEDLPAVRIDLDNPRGAVREFIAQEPVQREIAAQFKNLLRNHTDENGDQIYKDRMRDMCTSNKQSLAVSFEDLAAVMPNPAIWLADQPKEMLQILHKAAKDVASEEFRELFENEKHLEVYVRITDLPIADSLRDIRQFHLNKLIRVAGVVTRRTGVFPQLQMVKYDCTKCGFVLGPFYQNTDTEVKPNSCPQCQTRSGFEVNVAQTIYRNYQKLTLQESPGTVPAGRLPRHKEVIMLHDLIDAARPGEQIEITGVYSNSYDAALNVKNGFPVFSTVIEANSVMKQKDQFAAFKLTDEDRQELHRLARDPRIGERIAKSIAPSIYGHGNIKMGIALALFGGQEKHPSGTHRLRGDINMLLLGDPGTAKSQFLKYIEKVAQRAVYTTGKGASAVGLTAAVQKDAVTKEWTLEGGALVLADKGVCLIDEFDKMNDQDRVSIHEAMEQQSISISKAGIVTSLQARCSVIAAANPIGGRYDSSRTFAENVELSDPILSRFDILCVVKDVVDPVLDERLAEFVVSSHMRAHPDAGDDQGPVSAIDKDVLPQEVLRKYVTYAKQTCQPKLQNADYDKIATVYTELRRESAVSHGMPIAVRHLESIIRMAEAHAMMHLREYVNDDDVDTAIRVMLESFVSTQKMGVQKALQKKFRQFISYKQDFVELLMATLQGLMREQLRLEQMQGAAADGLLKVTCRQLEERARQYNIHDLKPLLDSAQFSGAGFRLDDAKEKILHTY